MSFSAHTFEVHPPEGNLGFSFHETVSEGREIYFLAKFDAKTKEAQMCAESIFGAIVETLTEAKTGDVYDLFEDALKSANKEAQKLRANMPQNPEIVVAFFDFHNLYLSQSGESEAYLVRGTNISQITETPESEKVLFSNILSGQVSVDDTVLLCSKRILRFLTANQIVDVFGRSDFQGAVSMFRHELSAASEEDILVTAIGIGKQEEEASSAGFLSKVISKSKKALAKEESLTEIKEENQESEPLEEELEKDDFEDESFGNEEEAREEKESLKVGDLFKWIPSFTIKPKKNLLIIAGTVLGVIILSIGIKFIASYESADTKELREQLSIAREALVQADTFLIQGERQMASEYLEKSKEAVQTVLNSRSKNFRSDAQFLLADIEEKQLQVENARKVNPQLLADLGVKNDNLDAVGLLALKGNLFVYDLNNVYKTVRNIVEKGLPISDQETLVSAAVREDQNTLLFLTDTPRIIEYREGLITPMSTEDDTWKRGIDIQTYGRFAYILDPVENQIWKYERKRSQYSPAVAYNQGADLSRSVSMTIDGSIYILSDDGTIQKLFRGSKVDYAFRDLPSVPFSGKNLKIYTTPELDFLYVLDPTNARILVFVKGDRFATYKKQVLFDLPDARDFHIDDSGQKVNVLTTDKIYEFPL
ncbi:protein phosphatase 2C family protein [Candidatus Gracilibacteria bacterium]|nr:protein phosphatase 2C family protein [Candidatus Gracilibacteria bacterium]MCF7819278.1 protein phosphatase 2C family protein [Candidatus Gracilibacteria bacterium]